MSSSKIKKHALDKGLNQGLLLDMMKIKAFEYILPHNIDIMFMILKGYLWPRVGLAQKNVS